ncbi:LacI family transcriptional regulator [Salmonella enterica]|nr:LacI family transcriptional regulator [Salmonella enterica]ECF6944655.1 LacI family transcriptional regulator [Salmonella enterica subsp. diarizonae]EAZ4770398.1 LacI family transcriptional regulator [Salmonella enterica]EBE3318860.1 LacI family transcriptional regulator [Salmonella enterica]EBL9883679.1 LacI family transcriptional regulator [Salmonella enterica]
MSLSSANSKDVARLANVSQSTVSLVFNGKTKGRVSEDTRARVLAVAKTLGYQPNVSAQILRNGSPKNIAFVVPDLQQPYFGKLVYAAELTAAEKGHSVILLDSISSEQWCDRLITLFQSKVIYGCIIYSCDEIVSNKLQSYRNQIIYIEPDDEAVYDIDLNFRTATEDIYNYLVKTGKRRVGYFRSDLPRKHFIRRHRAFESQLNLLPYPDKAFFVEYSSFPLENASLIAEKLLSNQLDVIICDDDLLAGAVYRAAKKMNISIPADIAVIGFNDTVLCQYLDPELSTIRIPADMIGNLAVSMLINKTQDSPSVVNSFLIDLMYIERESTS